MTIAVLVPTYDRPAFLAEALASISRQTYQDFHVYVVDDGSAVPAVVPDDPRFTVKLMPHRGIAPTFNTLLDCWRDGGEELATWLGDDDMLRPDALRIQVTNVGAYDLLFTDLYYTDMAHLKSHQSGVAVGQVRTCDPSRYTADYESFYDNINMGTSTMKRTVLDHPGFDERFTSGIEDCLWIYSLFMRGCKIGHIAVPTRYYRIHPGNNSNVERMAERPDYLADVALLPKAVAEIQQEVLRCHISR